MKYAVITGASSGIGFASAKKLLEKGYKVFNLDIKKSSDPKVESIICDVTDEQTVVDALGKIDKIDVLINCAGVFGCYYVEDTEESFLNKIIDVNMKGYFIVTKNALPKLRQSKGNIVFVSSGIGINADPTCPAYCMTKAGINIFAKCLALTEIKNGIRVNAVLPGPIKTPLLLEWFQNESELTEYSQINPQGIIGEPSNVADAICFLCDDNNNYVNGSFLAVDGGESISTYLPKEIKYRIKNE